MSWQRRGCPRIHTSLSPRLSPHLPYGILFVSFPLTPFADFATKNSNPDGCISDFTTAYTLTDELDSREKIHFCDDAWTRGSVNDVDCATLDPFPSTKIDAFSRIVIRQIISSSSVYLTFSDSPVTDVTNADGVPADDPARAHGLVNPAQDAQGFLAVNNADSYAWMSLDAFISSKCSQGSDWSSYFTQDPPPYVVEE